MDPVSVGVLGCGAISDAYLDADDRFDAFDVVACGDLDEQRARATADEYGVVAHDPAGLLADERVDLVVNLTPPDAHAETCRAVLESGRHVYVEKPLATTPDDAADVTDAAAAAGLRVGAAPDTFLGAGLQTCRSVLDDGRIGEPVGATAVWLSGGHESWHQRPEIFYRAGGGPLFDMGPYYVTALVSLLGPAARVTGATGRAADQRPLGGDPDGAEPIDVDVPTHEAATVEFEDGAIATVVTSFDAPGGTTLPDPVFEVYGTRGTLALPDPNQFGGPVAVQDPGGDREAVSLTHADTGGRGAGVADLARAIRGDWIHRSSGALARHVVEILAGVREAAATGAHVAVETTVERPPPLPRQFPSGASH